ncbi:MAG: N-acetylmuramic acid 6-phosphate etherase [Ruthenibacterium sp.]
MDSYFQALGTEQINRETSDIDLCTTLEMVTLMNQQDAQVPKAVNAVLPQIAQAVDLLHSALSGGGRMIYLGAGTSGRLGVLDASECPPTFSTPADLVQGYIAGGDIALRQAVEGCEDSREQGCETIVSAGVTAKDVVIGITASGSAPYVLAAIEEAKKRGAATIGVVTNSNTRLAEICDICIAPLVGPEVLTGSTRLKSGTAQKLVLNMLTTCTMIQLGKVYHNLMVDLSPSNDKLRDRAQRIIQLVTGVDEQTAILALYNAGNNTKLAIMMLQSGLSAEKARILLEAHGGLLRKALQDAAAT